MNLLPIVALLVLTAAGTLSPSLPAQEGRKFFWQEEVVSDGPGQDVLWLNAISYATKVKKAGKRKPAKPRLAKNSLSQEGSFFVYTKGLFTPQIHGEIVFKISIEVKENSYKFTLSDFVFQFYEKNRYGQYAPVSGKSKPLEDKEYVGMQDVWEGHRSLAVKVAENHIRVLKKEMKKESPAARHRQEQEQEELN